jgi:hypothetical protein
VPSHLLVGHGIGGGAELPPSAWTFGCLAGAAVVVTLGLGWNLFGTADRSADCALVSPVVVVWVQVALVVAGHVAAVVLAHDRALAGLPEAVAMRSQYPLVAAFVAFAVGGIGLLVAG